MLFKWLKINQEIFVMNHSQIEAEVWQFVQAMNRVWTVERNCEKLADYFHQEMVAIAPNEKNRLEGREKCIAGWKSFVDAAVIHYWKETDPKIQLYNNNQTAIVTYYYETEVDMFGQHIILKGRDMYTLVKEDGQWWVVADQFSSFPQ
jgi:hypothetical protein